MKQWLGGWGVVVAIVVGVSALGGCTTYDLPPGPERCSDKIPNPYCFEDHNLVVEDSVAVCRCKEDAGVGGTTRRPN